MWLDLYLKIFQKLPSVSYNVYLIKHTECNTYCTSQLKFTNWLLFLIMMSQEQLKVNYWSVIVKLSYSVANYVITAQQSSWSQITDCCFFFVNCHPPWVTSGTLYWSSGQGPGPPTLCPCRGRGRSPRPSPGRTCQPHGDHHHFKLKTHQFKTGFFKEDALN